MGRHRKIHKVPVVGYFIHLIEAFFRLPKNDLRIAEIRREIGLGPRGSARQDETLDDLLPQFLNSISSVSAFAHQLGGVEKNVANQSEQIGKLWERIEFVRREILYEMAHGANSDQQVKQDIQSRIIATDAVDKARAANNLRLNLGCGHIPLTDYINVDMRELPNVDVVAKVDAIPFDPGTVDEIHSAHLVEHFPHEALTRRLLPHWHTLLKDGGTFRAITPDGAAMIEAAKDGTYGFEDFREVLFGGQDYDGDYHYNLLSPESMSKALQDAGFKDIQIPVAGRRNGKCYEFEIVARKA